MSWQSISWLRNERWCLQRLTWLLLIALLCGCGRGPDVSVAKSTQEEAVEAEAETTPGAVTQLDAAAIVAENTAAGLVQADGNGDRQFTRFDALMAGLSIFVLAVFVGFEVITKVPPTLHTPLMSGSNAISGITLVGALLVAGRQDYAAWLGVLAVVFAMINAIGGFWVTHRMLSMFKRK